MNFRSLYKIFFKTDKPKQYGTRIELLNGYNAVFTNYDNKIYDDTSVRSCIDAIARNGAKLNPKHIIITKNKIQIDNNSAIARIISKRPNELMNAFDFYYKIISELYLNNNAFVYIQRDSDGNLTGLYPIKAGLYELLEYKNNVYIRFSFGTGKKYVASLQDDVIHLKRFFCQEDIIGGNSAPIVKTMSLKHIVSEGLINAIKTTSGIKGVLKSTKAILKPEDVTAMRNQFVKDFIESQDGSGIAGLDGSTEFKEININPHTATDGQISSIKNEIKDYFGINDAIIQSSFKEDEWNAFYESVLEPIGIMLSLEFTNKILSPTEQSKGDLIVFEANRLQYASNNTKITIIKEAGQLGLLTVNEAREILNLAPVDDGDKRLQSLNYIDSKIANNYQGGKENE